jgi:hypothetical protein
MANAVDRAVDHPRCVEAVVAQGGDEGLGVPVAERRVIYQPFASGRFCSTACRFFYA